LGTTGLVIGTGAGQVSFANMGTTSYDVIGHSKSGNTFTISKLNGAGPTRTCTQTNKGACPASGNW
jgi:hypothetical protein